jgi:hypothetical protein
LVVRRGVTAAVEEEGDLVFFTQKSSERRLSQSAREDGRRE